MAVAVAEAISQLKGGAVVPDIDAIPRLSSLPDLAAAMAGSDLQLLAEASARLERLVAEFERVFGEKPFAVGRAPGERERNWEEKKRQWFRIAIEHREESKCDRCSRGNIDKERTMQGADAHCDTETRNGTPLHPMEHEFQFNESHTSIEWKKKKNRLPLNIAPVL